MLKKVINPILFLPLALFFNSPDLLPNEKKVLIDQVSEKKSNIPFLTTWATLDLYSFDEPNLVGTFGVAASRYGNFAVQKADFFLNHNNLVFLHYE